MRINVQIDIPEEVLADLTQNMKEHHKKNGTQGRLDTFAALGGLVTRFLAENGFADWAADPEHYD